MISKFNFKKLFKTLFIAVLTFSATTQSFAQEKESTDLKQFKIIVERTENGLKMQSLKGSAWLDLSFSLNDDQSQTIDEYGAIDLDNASSIKDSNLADFLFTVTKTEKGIKLKGVEGTAWLDLSFSLSENEKKAINEYGMTELD